MVNLTIYTLIAVIVYSYQRFLSIVAEGRDMEKSEVEKIASGRVWSGGPGPSGTGAGLT